MRKNLCVWMLASLIVSLTLNHRVQADDAALLSDDPGNAKWHLEAKSRTIVFIGADNHPTRIAFNRKELANVELTIDSDSDQFAVMNGLMTIQSQWVGGGKKTLTFDAVSDTPSLLVSSRENPAFKGRWTAMCVSNKDSQILLEFPGASYANLSYQILGAQSLAPVPADSAGLKHATADSLRADLAETDQKLEQVKARIATTMANDPDYLAAKAEADLADKQMASATQDNNPDDIAKAATKQIECKTALNHIIAKFDSADPDFNALTAREQDIKQQLLAFGPLTSRPSWDVRVAGKPPVNLEPIKEQIREQLETLRTLGPTENPSWSYYEEHHRVLTPSEVSANAAANTRNAQRQTAERKLEDLQHQMAQLESSRMVAATMDDGTGVSIYAYGSTCSFVDTMQIGEKYTIKGRASMENGALRINLASAVPTANISTP